jgi:hypothetical protein
VRRTVPHLQAFGEIISRGGVGKCTLGDDIGWECDRDWTLVRFWDTTMWELSYFVNVAQSLFPDVRVRAH